MRAAEGFVTDDGTFFESEQEAALYEAELVLRKACPEGVDDGKLIALIQNLMPQVWGYINAHNAASAAKRNQQAEDADRAEADDSREATADAGLGHVSSTEEDLASLLKLPSRGHVDVPDVGSRPRAEEVSKRREEHGPRVRGTNAPSVRSRKNMAAK